jgi:hypothetical protein
MGEFNSTGYSASVRLWLKYGERMIPLSHSGGSYVIPRDPIDLPAGDGAIVLEIDGTRYERPVTLPGGMRSDDREVVVSSRDEHAPF